MTKAIVEIVPSDGEFVVRVVENEKVHERSFSNVEFAQSYAAGQSIRLEQAADCDEMTD